VPKRTIINERKRATFPKGGRERSKEWTITLSCLSLLILLKGLSSLIVLIAP